MMDLLIYLVQTNMAFVGKDNEYDNDMEDYDSKNAIICGKQNKYESLFKCLKCKFSRLVECSFWHVD